MEVSLHRPGGSRCLGPDELLGYLGNRADAPAPEVVQPHLDDCDRCRVLMAEAARQAVAPRAAGWRVARTLADGDCLSGRYEIARFIARGGMGEVYEARDRILGEPVALKTLALASVDQGDAAEGLLAEVRLARKVTHPNVCRILEVGIHRADVDGAPSIPFLTMELLVGETLAARLARRGPLEPAAARALLRDVAAGLGAAHRARVVHRDFKSDNVFLVAGDDGSERAVVMDFGLARALVPRVPGPAGAAGSGSLVGTLAYMAPEQLEGAPATPAMDVYALGIVVFEMLTGQAPCARSSLVGPAAPRQIPPPSSLRPGLPRAWDAVVRRCVEREPARRFASVDEAVATLDRLLGASRPRAAAWDTAVAAGTLVLLAAAVAAWLSAPRAVPTASVQQTPRSLPQTLPARAPESAPAASDAAEPAASAPASAARTLVSAPASAAPGAARPARARSERRGRVAAAAAPASRRPAALVPFGGGADDAIDAYQAGR